MSLNILLVGWICWCWQILEPIVKNGRPPTSHSMHSFLHQYTGSFKKPPLRRPHSVIGGSLGSFMAMPRNGSRLGNMFHLGLCIISALKIQANSPLLYSSSNATVLLSLASVCLIWLTVGADPTPEGSQNTTCKLWKGTAIFLNQLLEVPFWCLQESIWASGRPCGIPRFKKHSSVIDFKC